MKVFIISDIEGVAGVVKGEQTGAGEPLYEEARKLYTQEINAAVRGAKAAGGTEIVAMDCHGAGSGYTFNSLLPEELDPDCEFVVQDQWTEYTEFLEQGVDAALFVGMHARAGTAEGVLNHTVSGRDFQNLWFNGTLVGETGINAALCGTWGCPVLLVTGDQAACSEGSELLGGGLTTVQVKRGTGVQSARNLVPSRAREAIEQFLVQSFRVLGHHRMAFPGQRKRHRGRDQIVVLQRALVIRRVDQLCRRLDADDQRRTALNHRHIGAARMQVLRDVVAAVAGADHQRASAFPFLAVPCVKSAGEYPPHRGVTIKPDL